MDIDVSIDNESMSITIDNPYSFDLSDVMQNLVNFGIKFGIDISSLEIEKLIPKMIKGVAGCEGGCPSDAKSLIRQGFGDFTLSYIEGGILSAAHSLKNGKSLEIRIFPEFH